MFEFKVMNNQTIEIYKRYIKERLNEAIHLPFMKVVVNGRAPKANNCHENAQIFEDENTSYECIRGWLVIDGGDASSDIILSAHSAIKDTNNSLIYEITPIYSTEKRPFLVSYLSEDDFYCLHNHILKNNHDVKLIIEK